MPGTGGSPGALGAGEVTAEASPGGDLAPVGPQNLGTCLLAVEA